MDIVYQKGSRWVGYRSWMDTTSSTERREQFQVCQGLLPRHVNAYRSFFSFFSFTMRLLLLLALPIVLSIPDWRQECAPHLPQFREAVEEKDIKKASKIIYELMNTWMDNSKDIINPLQSDCLKQIRLRGEKVVRSGVTDCNLSTMRGLAASYNMVQKYVFIATFYALLEEQYKEEGKSAFKIEEILLEQHHERLLLLKIILLMADTGKKYAMKQCAEIDCLFPMTSSWSSNCVGEHIALQFHVAPLLCGKYFDLQLTHDYKLLNRFDSVRPLIGKSLLHCFLPLRTEPFVK